MAQSVTIHIHATQSRRRMRIGAVVEASNFGGAAPFYTIPNDKRMVLKMRAFLDTHESDADGVQFSNSSTSDEYSVVLGGGVKLYAPNSFGVSVPISGFLEDDV